jgi:hypothetical protein
MEVVDWASWKMSVAAIEQGGCIEHSLGSLSMSSNNTRSDRPYYGYAVVAGYPVADRSSRPKFRSEGDREGLELRHQSGFALTGGRNLVFDCRLRWFWTIWTRLLILVMTATAMDMNARNSMLRDSVIHTTVRISYDIVTSREGD